MKNKEKFLKNLADAIKFKTISNNDENKVDWAEFERFHDFLEERYQLIHKTLEREKVSRASLLYRWKGSDGSLPPMAMIAHMDVVPVSAGTEKDWKHPPFSGCYDGKNLWGRGSLDMKNHLIGIMESVEALLEEGFTPKRDVYICLGQDEEVMSGEKSGALAMARLLKSRGVRLDSLNDEGGAILNAKIPGVINKRVAAIGVAEKGYVDFEISVNAKGGHSSQPPKHSALGVMADVIKDIENNQFKPVFTDLTDQIMDEAANCLSFPAKILSPALLALKPHLKYILDAIPITNCFVRTTTAVTMASGSPSQNVLPQKATINANFRIMPGTTIADVERHIRKVVKNKNIEVKMYKGQEPSGISDTKTESYGKLKRLCMDIYGKNTAVIPFLVMGSTDAYHYQQVTDNIYRFTPFQLDASLLNTAHGTNERLPCENLDEALDFFEKYIKVMSDD
ncbi:MAG: M20/M25/M40 family metallo-hydrolase [Oscillospiraceae bacterium]|nr:M20/M25/M40 family metallo-hydrolase [Oscillospiraceae bacterium]